MNVKKTERDGIVFSRMKIGVCPLRSAPQTLLPA